MLLDNFIKIKINRNNKKYYEEISEIKSINNGDIIKVHFTKVKKYSKAMVNVKCDYCGEERNMRFCDYIKIISGITPKYACKKCINKKIEESNLKKYGVTNANKLKTVKDKIKKTNLEKYGCESFLQTEEYKIKTKKTNLEKYGCENVFQNEDIQTKQKDTCMEKYGCDNVFQNEDIKKKIKQTMIKKYGADHPMHVESIKNKVLSQSLITKYQRGNNTYSNQQYYLYILLGGELNYPIDRLSLDIAFPKEKIYIEYNGSGHNIDVKYNKVTEKEFNIKEIHRYTFLKSKGWKGIFINSPQDYLPSDEIIINEIEKAKKWISEDGKYHSHYNIEINTNNFKELRKIK